MTFEECRKDFEASFEELTVREVAIAEYFWEGSRTQALFVNVELLAAAKAFIAWADDCWGSWAISETTPETLAQYNAAKEAITRAESQNDL